MKFTSLVAAGLLLSVPISAADRNGPAITNVLSASIAALEAQQLEDLHTNRSPENVSCYMREAKFLGTAKTALGTKHLCKFVFVVEGTPNPKVTAERFGLHGHVAVLSEDFRLEGVLHLDDGRDASLYNSVFFLGIASIDLSTHEGLIDFQKRLHLTFPPAEKPRSR
jgi:hypothetical protein